MQEELNEGSTVAAIHENYFSHHVKFSFQFLYAEGSLINLHDSLK